MKGTMPYTAPQVPCSRMRLEVGEQVDVSGKVMPAGASTAEKWCSGAWSHESGHTQLAGHQQQQQYSSCGTRHKSTGRKSTPG